MSGPDSRQFGSPDHLLALTLHQPWASFCAHELKLIETRGWSTSYRGPIAIHAAASIPAYAREFCEEPAAQKPLQIATNFSEARFPLEDQLPLGAIVAVAELYDCRPMSTAGSSALYGSSLADWVNALSEEERVLGHYADGRFGLFLRNVVRLPEPVPCRGFQKFWNVPPAELACVLQQIEEAKKRTLTIGDALRITELLAPFRVTDEVSDASDGHANHSPSEDAAPPAVSAEDAAQLVPAPMSTVPAAPIAPPIPPILVGPSRTPPTKRDRLLPGEKPWPRLSESLAGLKHPDRCQSCSRSRAELTAAGFHLQAWREHAQDEAARRERGEDLPEQVFLMLCTACNREKSVNGIRQKSLVMRHPRFYSELEKDSQT